MDNRLNMQHRIINFLGSSKFFSIILAFFLAQGVFFALSVKPSDVVVSEDSAVTRSGGVVPDGNRHLGAIYEFAQKPLAEGPFINNMSDDELWMGDLERFPSYLYYYIMGLIVKGPIALGASDDLVILIVRVAGLVLGLLSLIVLRKIAQEVKAGKVVANTTVLAFALTGSFAWLAPAENYDVMALLVFFLFLLASIKLFSRNDVSYVYPMAIWFFLGSITKYTYMPFMAILGLISVIVFVRNSRGLSQAWHHFVSWIKKLTKKKLIVAGSLLILLGSLGLFAERFGINLIEYGSLNPECSQVHEHEACLNFGVYERNYSRAAAIDSGRVDNFNFNPVEYAGLWLHRYYTSAYAYVGHIWIYSFWVPMYVGAALALIAVMLALVYSLRNKIRFIVNRQQKFILFTVLLFVSVQVLVNVGTYINYAGGAYAHQGRYLMAAIALAYILILMMFAKVYEHLYSKRKVFMIRFFVITSIILIITNSALPVFLVHADSPEWYSDWVRAIVGE